MPNKIFNQSTTHFVEICSCIITNIVPVAIINVFHYGYKYLSI